MSEPILIETISDGIATLTLNRPERRNALNGELMDLLLAAVRRVGDDHSVRAVVLTGAGGAFCAGGDIRDGGGRSSPGGKDRPHVSQPNANELRRLRGETSCLLHRMPKPTIALLSGPVMGAGLSLALACDLRLASTTLKMRTAFVSAALSGDYGVGYFLPRLVGLAKATELMLLNVTLDAEQAQGLGLVNSVLEDALLNEGGQLLARQLADGPTVAYAAVKSNLAAATSPLQLEEYLSFEAENQTRCHETRDVREAGRAFLEKRPPRFSGM